MQTLFYGGTIVTMCHEGEFAEAILIEDGKIVFVGDEQEARIRMTEPVAQVCLEGHTVLPAFIDSHSHLCQTAQYEAFVSLRDCQDFEDMATVLKAYLQAHADQTVVIATGYDHNFLKEGTHPTKAFLDEISPNVPLLLLHASGHCAVANTAMLLLAGIQENTPAPDGGKYGRDKAGKLNGYIEEIPALAPVMMRAYRDITIDFEAQLQAAQSLYLKHGITTVQEGALSQEGFAQLYTAAQRDILQVDVVAYVMTEEVRQTRDRFPQCVGQYHHRVKLGGAKMVLDGSPQARSAWLKRPYQGEEDYKGYPAHDDDFVRQAVSQSLQEKIQLLAHCNGDAAAEQYLCALQAAGAPELFSTLRPVMIHCQCVEDSQLDRMAALSVIPSFFVAHTYYWGDIHYKNLGEARASRISPLASAVSRGLPLTLHQDTPIVPPDMLHTVWCAVNRRTREGKILGVAQRISVYEALQAITVNAAYSYHEESCKGTLAAGKLADLVILDRNPFEVPVEELASIRVLETIKEGITVFQESEKSVPTA